jgi:tetratricopeptide (TPR) repeat protein
MTNPEEAVLDLDRLRAAAARAAGDPEMQLAVGVALRERGAPEDALHCLQRVALIAPEHAAAHYERGLCLQDLGRRADAAEAYRQALDCSPDLAPAHNNLANLLLQAGDACTACFHYRRAAALLPANAEVQRNLGSALAALGEPESALAAFRRALDLAPGDVAARCAIGHALADAGRTAEAETWLRQSVAAHPTRAMPLTALARLLLAEQPQTALGFARQALTLAPDDATAWFYVGIALLKQAQIDEAVAALRSAAERNPNGAGICSNLGNALRQAGAPAEEALGWIERAVALEPAQSRHRYQRSILQLALGRFGEGWIDYECRLETQLDRPLGVPAPEDWESLPPRWQGEPLAGERVLVLPEQGPGDMVMFAQCLPDLLAAGAAVELRVERRLRDLLSRSFPDIAVEGFATLADAHSTPAAADVCTMIGSLPRAFRRSEATFPRPRRYLQPDPDRVTDWRARLAETGRGPWIGVSWRGGATPLDRHHRGMALADWLPILRAVPAGFVCLQYGARQAELAALASAQGIAIADWPDFDPVADVDGFAALIDALDAVVSVANTTVHFAAALGKPVWNLVPAVASWRWMVERADSPWYPTMRIHRQHRGEPWSRTLQRLATTLPGDLDAAMGDEPGAPHDQALSRLRRLGQP